MLRILGLTSNLHNACGYYRMVLPLREIGRRGHDTVVADRWVARPDYDILVAQRIGRPDETARFAEHSGLTRVYEIDDDMFTLHEGITQRWPELADPAFQEGMVSCLRMADLVTVSTPDLAHAMTRLRRDDIVVLQNRIDDSLLDITRPRRERVTIGFSGGDTHVFDIDTIAGRLTRFLRRNPRVDLHFIGFNYTSLIKAPTRHTPWQHGVENFYRSIDFDIGIAPLQVNRFNRSKSHIRALEYAALGIPVVAADVPAYRDMVIDGQTGFLIRRDHEWDLRLRDLVNDADMRAEMGARARVHAANFTIQRGAADWERAYAGSRSRARHHEGAQP